MAILLFIQLDYPKNLVSLNLLLESFIFYHIEKTQPFVFGRIKKIIKIAILMLSLMLLMRLIYSYLFLDWLEAKKNPDLFFKSLFLGFRYDLIPTAYILFVPYLLYFSCFLYPREKWMVIVNFISRLWIFGGITLLTTILICDIGFYSYYSEHINAIFFGLFEDDTSAVLSSIWKNYNVPLWAFLIFLCLGIQWWILKRILKLERIDLGFEVPYHRNIILSLFLFGLMVFAFLSRGNFSRLPLSIEDSHISQFEKINHLSLNGVIALNRAIRIRKDHGADNTDYLKQGGFVDIKDALASAGFDGSTLDHLKKVSSAPAVFKNNLPHVVMTLIESWGNYWWDMDAQDFNTKGEFSIHEKADWFFPNIIPSENGTIGSLSSLLSGLPIRPGSRYVSEGKYAKTKLPSSFHLPFAKSQYKTYFLYGGKLGWRQIGQYAKALGYHELKGAAEISKELNLKKRYKERDLGNEWGIFDEYLLEYVEKILKEAKEPTFIFLLTTSNHPPYEFPSHYKKLPLELTSKRMGLMTKTKDEMQARFLGLQYINQTFGEFLTRIKLSDLKEKTVIAATGDHSFWIAKNPGLQNEIRRFSVPFYLYLPDYLKTISPDLNVIGTHLDIAPTLYELFLPEQSYYQFGTSLLSQPRFAYNAAGLMSDQLMGRSSIGTFCSTNFPLVQSCDETSAHQKLVRKYQAMMALTDELLKSVYQLK